MYESAHLTMGASFSGLGHKAAKIVFLGLDNAGKTTLMQMLRDGRVTASEPTRHASKAPFIICSPVHHNSLFNAQLRRNWLWERSNSQLSIWEDI